MTVDIVYLIPFVRLRIGDMDALAYRYTDAWITQALILAIKGSQRFWHSRYTVTDAGLVSRNLASSFSTAEADGVIEDKDEPIIVVLASIYMLEGSLENSAWSTASWKDAEISYSNLEGARTKDSNLKRLLDELYSYITPPSKRLAHTIGGRLPGFGEFEKSTKY